MVEVIVVILLAAAALAAFQPAHRRTWRPGLDTRFDRDRARLIDELALLESFDEPQPAPPVARFDGECQELSPSNAGADPYRRFISSRSDRNRNNVAAALAATSTASSTQRPAVGA
ncbi:MAG: hypothetical protein CVT62_09575 [Actinobacteria bacterium HGW-Actinobacteria-2]|nr:MAG: hypothetical protein CVT62_09575 [Actinobacteria bacterium HGW-Actinobacteria-2]